MRATRKARPQLESLETMTLLSGIAGASATGMTLNLSGTQQGTFAVTRSHSGRVYDFNAKGTLTPLGSTTTTGTLHVASGVSMGPPNGTLHLTTGEGTLTLQIPESVMIPAGVPTPTSKNEIVDTYVITSGTGAYQGDTGSGVVEFTLHTAPSDRHGRGHSVAITFTSLFVSPPATGALP